MDFIVDLTPGMMIFKGIDVVITPRNTKIITAWDYIDIDSFQNITHSNRPSLPIETQLAEHWAGIAKVIIGSILAVVRHIFQFARWPV